MYVTSVGTARGLVGDDLSPEIVAGAGRVSYPSTNMV